MKQYTTPVIQWIFKYINLSTIEQIRVIIKDEANHVIEITDPEIHGNVVQVRLTQEQTASLKKVGCECNCIGVYLMGPLTPAMRK